MAEGGDNRITLRLLPHWKCFLSHKNLQPSSQKRCVKTSHSAYLNGFLLSRVNFSCNSTQDNDTRREKEVIDLPILHFSVLILPVWLSIRA
jgi:hypothetical protein